MGMNALACGEDGLYLILCFQLFGLWKGENSGKQYLRGERKKMRVGVR
jgi:hypothetical protein